MVLAHKLCAWLLLALGAVHGAYTFFDFKTWSLAAAWFFRAGLALIFLALLNLAAVGTQASRYTLASSLAANVLALVYFIGVVVLLPVPQAFLGIVLVFVLVVTTSHRLRKGTPRQPSAA